MRALILRAAAAVALQACAAMALVGCQDAAASNSERETHMGDVRAAVDQAPALPPAPSNAVPIPLSVAMPGLIPPPPPQPALPPSLVAADAGPAPKVPGTVTVRPAKAVTPPTH
jgi:hypothetical protein